MSDYKEKMIKSLKRIHSPDRFCISSPSKITIKGNSAFSLPAGPTFSCPGATDSCVDCYATKHRHLFPNVQDAFAGNWKIIRNFEKNNDCDSAITMLAGSIPNDSKIFRIHESGDFYSQWYVDVWNKVIKTRSDVSFWAYTRSFNLNFKNIIKNKNFVLWASTDSNNIEQSESFIKNLPNVKYAYGPWNHTDSIPDNSFICPVTNHILNVNGACEKCKLCVTEGRTKKNVVFLKH